MLHERGETIVPHPESQRARRSGSAFTTKRAKFHPNLLREIEARVRLLRFAELRIEREVSQRKSQLGRKLLAAHWPLETHEYRLLELCLGLNGWLLTLGHTIFLQLLCAIIPSLIMRGILGCIYRKRTAVFEAEFPHLLETVNHFLSVGFDPMTALRESGAILPEDSLLRREVQMIAWRREVGIHKTIAMQSFGESIDHPRFELFHACLMFSERDGGSIIGPMQRLARVVRHDLEFKRRAAGAAGYSRGSMQLIVVILISMLGYLWYMSPDVILASARSPLGRYLMEGGVFVVVIGFLWVNQVARMKL